MKDDESPSRDTRLDPLDDVVSDPTVPGGVLLPSERTEVLPHAPIAPFGHPGHPGHPGHSRHPGHPNPPTHPSAVPPRLPVRQPPAVPPPQPPGAASTQKLGGFGGLSPSALVPRVGPPAPPPSLGPTTDPAAPTFRRGSLVLPDGLGEGEGEGDATTVGSRPEGLDLVAPPPPGVTPGVPLGPVRPRHATQPLIGSTAKDVVFLPTEAPPVEDAIPRPSERPPGSAAGEGIYARLPRLTSGWPFVPIAPLLVVIIGLVVAFAIGLVGIDQLARSGEEHAGARAELLAVTVAARLSALPPERRLHATQVAARRSSSEMLVLSERGDVLHDATLGVPDAASLARMLKSGKGALEMQRLGRARYAMKPLSGGDRLIVLVPEPRIAEGESALVSALAALTVLLLGVAAGVAYAVSRDVTRDVDFVTDRVRTMAQIRTEPTGELIPARTIDEIGILTATFNRLVARFGRASQQYRSDLARASVADRERAAFLAAVSHELRSPLNAILGFADILMEEVDGPLSPSAKEEVEQIRGSGQHLLGLINDILEFSALESGQLRLARSRVDVLALANEVLKESRGLVGDRPLTVRIEGESLVARVDARRVRQILGNLVNNAIKFTQQGEVVVRVRKTGTFAHLSVTDTGPGISETDRALIFEEFQQARTERGRRRGTGLGLAITRRLVALHGGTITVQSELGRGSTFEVHLPIGNVDAPPSRKLLGPGGSLAPGSVPPPSVPP